MQIFIYRFIKFLYNHETERFEPIILDTYLPFEELRARYTKLKSENERKLGRIRFGECVVDVPRKSVLALLIQEVLNPFYIF